MPGMSNKLKIKCSVVSENIRINILKIFSNFDIKCSKLVNLQNNSNECVASFHDSSDIDKVFTDECLNALSAYEASPKIPPELKAKRSVIVRNIDRYIYDRDDTEILQEINKENNSVNVIELYKFKNAKIIKLTFEKQLMANFCLEKGLKLFSLHLSPSDFQNEQHYEVKICYKCYSLDEHLAYECPKNNDYKICSTCSSSEHTYKNCTSSIKKCVNCSQNHFTMSYSCPKRREVVVKMKASTTNQGRNVTYRDAVVRENSGTSLNPQEINDNLVKSILCLVISKAKDAENPGSFETTLNHLQEINKVPKFSLGNISLPENLFNDAAKSVSTLQSPASHNQSQIPLNSTTSSPDVQLHHQRSEQVISTEPHLTSSAVVQPGPSSNIVSSESETNRTNAQLKIGIIKKPNVPSVTSRNFESLFKKGEIMFECTDNMTQQECLLFLKSKSNLLECKSALSKVKIKDFPRH